jgi:hypothetical protein
LQQHISTHGVDADLHYVMVSHPCAGMSNEALVKAKSSCCWCWYQHQVWLLQQYCLTCVALVRRELACGHFLQWLLLWGPLLLPLGVLGLLRLLIHIWLHAVGALAACIVHCLLLAAVTLAVLLADSAAAMLWLLQRARVMPTAAVAVLEGMGGLGAVGPSVL